MCQYSFVIILMHLSLREQIILMVQRWTRKKKRGGRQCGFKNNKVSKARHKIKDLCIFDAFYFCVSFLIWEN